MSDIRFDLLGPDDYDRGKSVLNKAKHPGFVGRELFYRCATSGRVCIAVLDDVDCGIAMVAKEKLQALSVIKSAQGRGVGGALIAHLKPHWANVIGERVAWFEKRGYRSVGAPKVGQNGKHAAQLMERDASAPSEAIELAPMPQVDASAPSEEEDRSPTFSELIDESPMDVARAELAILDALMAKANAAEKFGDSLKIMDAAAARLRAIRRERRY